MAGFTRLGTELWDWDPFIELSPLGRSLWLGLYTSGAAKRCPPGLWHGSLHVMADAARLQPDQTLNALDELIERDVAEFDPKTRVLRLMGPEHQSPLPDTGEWPMNGNHVRSWWSRFTTVPRCAVRDAHVATLYWLMEQGSVDRKTPLSHDHRHAWQDTFAAIQVPIRRARGVRRLAMSDTSTSVQPSLFPTQPPPLALPASSGASPVLAPVVLAETGYSQPVDNSVQNSVGNVPQLPPVTVPTVGFRDSNDSKGNYTVSDTPTDTDRDPDRDSVFSSLPSGGGSGSAASERSTAAPPAVPPDVPQSPPVLALVPGWTLPAVIDAIASEAGSTWPATPSPRLLDSLRFALSDLDAKGVGVNALRVLGRFLAKNPTGAGAWLAWIGRGGLVDVVVEAGSWYASHGICTEPIQDASAVPDVGGVG